MIILQDLFNILTTGPFANTALSGLNGVMKEEHYDKVTGLINLGIVELYKRFKFLENELTLHVTPNTRNYYLRSDRVTPLVDISDAMYIESVTDVDGFLNIIKVTSIFDSSGEELRIGNPNAIPTIIELAPDVLQITNILATQPISIVYQSYPNRIPAADFLDPLTYKLNIPETVIDPLVLYIAAKTFKPTGANDSTANADKSVSYEQQYELACQKLMLYGLSVQNVTERDTFEDKGWA